MYVKLIKKKKKQEIIESKLECIKNVLTSFQMIAQWKKDKDREQFLKNI